MENLQRQVQPPSNEREQHLQRNQLQNLYTQCFVCKCQRSFTTLKDYQGHLDIEHSDNYYITQAVGNPLDGINYLNRPFQLTGNLQPKNIPDQPAANYNQNFESWPVHNSNQRQEVQQFLTKRNLELQRQNQPSGERYNQIKTEYNKKYMAKPATEQIKQNLKHIQNYYNHRMSQFYRQFDIEPVKNPHAVKSKRQFEQLHKLQRRNSTRDADYAIQTTLQDFSIIEQELYMRMIPISKGITQFVDNFERENMKIINQVSPQQKQMISQVLRSRLYSLNLLNRLNEQRTNSIYMESPNPSDDFMNSDLLMALDAFMSFVSQTLKPTKFWLIQAMMIAILEVLMEYFSSRNDVPYKTLKVNDFSLFFTQITIRTEHNRSNSPIQVPSQYFSRLLMWFSQWSTIKQYMFNKFNTEFADSILQRTHEINHIYRENVRKYHKCVQKRKKQYYKKIKRKMIEKRRQKINRQKLAHTIENNLNQKSYNTNSYLPDYQRQNQNLKNRQNKTTTEKGFLYKQNTNNLKSRNCDLQLLNPHSCLSNIKRSQQEDRKVLLTNFKNSLCPQYNGRVQNPGHFKSDRQMSSKQDQARYLQKDQQNSNEDQYPYFPIYESQYVDYFSPQSIQARKKAKQLWKFRIEKLKLIIQDPSSFKPLIKDEIARQLKQVDQLSKTFQSQSIFPGVLVVRREGFDYYKDRNIVQRSQNGAQSFFNSVNSGVMQAQLNRLSHPAQYLDDPFIIMKNFRHAKSNTTLTQLNNLKQMSQRGTITISKAQAAPQEVIYILQQRITKINAQ